jgi:hypothetical protein
MEYCYRIYCYCNRNVQILSLKVNSISAYLYALWIVNVFFMENSYGVHKYHVYLSSLNINCPHLKKQYQNIIPNATKA